MARLKVSAGGKVTLEKEMLDHLGVKPGDELEADLLPDQKLAVHAVPAEGGLEDFFGSLKNEENIHLTLDDIKDAIADAWAGKR